MAGFPWGGLLSDGSAVGALDADVSGSTGELGLRLIRFWIDLGLTVAMAFVFSYFWTATTAIYFLLRRNVDATEMDEVYIPEEDDHGLPPLDHDAAGVAGVADGAPKQDGAAPSSDAKSGQQS